MGLLEKVVARTYELRGEGRWLKGVVHDSLVIDTDNQIFFWNSKELVGDVYVWLTKVEGMTYEQAKTFLKQFNDFSGSFIHTIDNSKELVVYTKLVDIFHENGLKLSTEYWSNRGINSETISRFKLGRWNDFYTIPIYQDGLFKNFQLRKDIPNKTIRYYYRKDEGAKGRLLFNSDILKITNKIIITEGPTDCLRLSQEGIPCVSHTAGAGGWEDWWYKYFIHQKEILVVYDNDTAGELGSKLIAEKLGTYRTKVFTFKGFDKGYDIVDFFRDGYKLEDFLKLIERGAKYSFV
jgi:DNA primase